METLAHLLPSTVAFESADAATRPDPLLEPELAAVARAIDKRRHEFALGRTCARRALVRLGLGPVAIPTRPDRAPVWPEGVVGSITHCTGFAAAAVARSTDLRGLGIDAEPATPPLEERLVRLICTPAEAEDLPRRPPLEVVDWPRLVFSAKEALYKAVAPASGVFLGFQDVELDVDPASATFRCRLLRETHPALPDFGALRGTFLVYDGFLLTAVVLPA